MTVCILVYNICFAYSSSVVLQVITICNKLTYLPNIVFMFIYPRSGMAYSSHVAAAVLPYFKNKFKKNVARVCISIKQ